MSATVAKNQGCEYNGDVLLDEANAPSVSVPRVTPGKPSPEVHNTGAPFSETIVSYRGKLISDMSREELISALHDLGADRHQMRKEHARERAFLFDLLGAKGGTDRKQG